MKITTHLLSFVILLSIITACGNQQDQKEEESIYVSDTKLTAALGKWQRTDAPYVLELNNIKTDSTVEAAYFNPNPINVAETQWKINDDYFYFFVKFDDEGYPGSYYSLGYFPQDDRLYGIYFQAVQGQQFEVEFERQ